jgi:putative SOS response-associated peptidase YedK
MCNDYRFRPLSEHAFEEFRQVGIELVFPSGKPNIEPRDDIRIGDTAPVVTRSGDAVALSMTKWAWTSPQGRPVFNFRSEGRSFANSTRCVIPTDGFYEFTDPQPGQKRKTKWLFTMKAHPTFWIAGLIRDGAFTMLTTAPGPDIAPYHDRQIVLLPPGQALEWLDLARPEAELLAPCPAGRLEVTRVFPES